MTKLLGAGAVLLVPMVVMLVASGDEGRDAPRASTTPDPATSACALAAAPVALPLALRESSGVAHAPDGSLWTHNDGSEARLYRITDDGAVAQTVDLEGVRADDIEDIEAAPCPGGAGDCLWLADTGDNDGERDEVALLVLPLPAPTARGARPARLAFRFADGPRDAEGLALSPSGDALVVTKGRDTPIEVYRVSTAQAEGARVARRVATIAAEPASARDRVTGAGGSPDGAWLALRTNDALAVYPTASIESGTAEPAFTFDLRPLGEPQGEGIDIASDGRIWLTSEGERGPAPVLSRLACRMPAG